MKQIIEKLGKKNKEIFYINGFYICETCGERLNNEIVKAINFSNEIYIGDVLERMKNKAGQILSFESTHLVNLWAACGTNKSLQQIEEGSGYEVGCEYCNEGENSALLNGSDFHLEGDEPIEDKESCEECGGYERLKDPHARALEQFISNLIL